MALSIKKTSARQLGQNSDRDVFAVYSGSKLYKHKTKSGMVFKFATTLPKAKEILQKLKSDGSSSETKRSGASQPKARAPSSSSAKMTVSSCSQFLRDAGYSVSKKKGKKTEDEEMSDQDIYLRDLMNPRKRTRKKQRKAADTLYGGKKGASKFHLKRELAALKRAQKSLRLDYNNDLISLDDYRIMDRNLESQMEMIERELGMYDSPRKNPNRSAYVVTFRIGGGRDEYQDTIMASSQTEAIRLAHDMMDEMGDGVLVSVVPQAVADAEIIFDFNNPRRKRRRKNPRAMRRLR